MTLWTSWKLHGLWRDADREVSRARRLLSDHPFWFRPASRAEIESAISRLELASRYEKEPRVLSADLRVFRATFDRFLPFARTTRFRRAAAWLVAALALAALAWNWNALAPWFALLRG
ncbi:MAG: hypothetical protein IT350_07285 [Deltaproteobacteria bacterium]|nr:hypothetical protein [Deltaproteobacteria bacterium]